MRTLSNALTLLAVLGTLGCSAIVDPEKNDPLATAEGFCNSIQDVANRMTCGVTSSMVGMPISFQAQAASDQIFAAYRGRCDALQADVNGGRYVYDGGAALGCIDALQRRGCRALNGEWFAWPDECARVLKGAVPVGGACLHDNYNYGTLQGGTAYRLNECAGGATCLSATTPTACGTATCRAPALQGMKCRTATEPEDCAEGLYCDTSNLCQAQHTDPFPCSGIPQACDPRSTACNYSLVPPMCQVLPGEGATCASSSPQCRAGLVCDTSTNFCVARPTAPIGEAGHCWNTSVCADGLYCDSATTRTCVRQRTSGGCMYQDECAPGYSCLYTGPGNTCTRLPDLGEPCTTDATTGGCRPGLICDAVYPVVNGKCALPPGEGQRCLGAGAATGVCAPGLRCFDSGAPSYTQTCLAFLAEGAACSWSYECGLDAGTGRECVAKPPDLVSRCWTNACLVPAGWFAKGSMY